MSKLKSPPLDKWTGFFTGHGLSLRKDRLGFMYQSMIEYGDFVEFKIGKKFRTLMINNPEGIEHILIKNAKNYTKKTIGYKKVSQITGNGIFTDSDERWKTARRISAPLFTGPKLDTYYSKVKNCCKKLIEEISLEHDKSNSINISPYMTKLTLQVLGQCIFNYDLGDYSHEIDVQLTKLIEIKNSQINDLFPYLSPKKYFQEKEFHEATEKLDKIILKLIGISKSKPNYEDSFINALEQSPDAVDPKYVNDQVKTFAFAGHETSASVLSWAFYFLRKHEDLQFEIAQEIRQITNDPFTLEKQDLNKFVKLEKFIKEVMRHRPPAWSFGRYAEVEDTIFDEKIYPGDIITLSPFLTHHNPELYQNAQNFNPENFNEENINKRHRCAFIPFGNGPRVCIGAELAMLEIMQTIIVVLFNFKIEQNIQEIEMAPLISLRPKENVVLKISKV